MHDTKRDGYAANNNVWSCSLQNISEVNNHYHIRLPEMKKEIKVMQLIISSQKFVVSYQSNL